METKKPLVFRYKNWEGNIAIRKIMPITIWYGVTEWHKDEQWFLKALDLDKNTERDFAIRDILSFE